MPDSSETVLVTGGTGFLGSWCIATLLDRGYSVRTTVRDASREQQVRTQLAAAGADPGERLTIAVADLTSDAGWPEAVAGCKYVLHVASPFPPSQPKDPDELIVPARDGSLRVLKAALEAGAERIVLTSSVASIRGNRAASQSAPFTEDDWTDGADTSKSPYVRSKATAERAAWDYVEAEGKKDRLVTICPGAIIGPALSDDTSFSLELVERLMKGVPAMPRLGYGLVDVRDVADMEVRAMTDPAAAGQRFIAADKFMWMSDVAEVLKERLPEASGKVPSRKAPDFLIKAMAIFDPGIKSVVGDLGQRSDFSSEKARTTLGWSPRPVEDSITETAQSLIDQGVVKPA